MNHTTQHHLVRMSCARSGILAAAVIATIGHDDTPAQAQGFTNISKNDDRGAAEFGKARAKKADDHKGAQVTQVAMPGCQHLDAKHRDLTDAHTKKTAMVDKVSDTKAAGGKQTAKTGTLKQHTDAGMKRGYQKAEATVGARGRDVELTGAVARSVTPGH